MDDSKYCIVMRNVRKIREGHTLPLVLLDSEKDIPVLAESIGQALFFIKGYKEWHLKIEFKIRDYYRKSNYAYEIMGYGTWLIGNKVLSAA